RDNRAMGDALATVDGQLQLIVSSAAHRVPWLKDRADVQCVVEVAGVGLVWIRPLDRWSELHGIAADEAEQSLIADEGTSWEDQQYPVAFVVTAMRKVKANTAKPGKGPSLHELKLPALAVLALFHQGTGPLRPQRRGRPSGTVILRTYSDAIELLGQPLISE
ncbi:MAG: hypothetical protein AAB385_06465, partial [Planctomycetota bacterium]